ncbi:MAG: dihydroneopterin aldolase family protein [Candidatus Lokiarchaeota archaeon]
MKSNQNKIYFAKDLSNRERASFELGIKLGALYHILCGIPISKNEYTISSIEKGIEAAISTQPFVKSVNISLNKSKIIGTKSNQYDYDEVTGKIIDAKVKVVYENIEIVGKIKWIDNLNYPLMYVDKIIKRND